MNEDVIKFYDGKTVSAQTFGKYISQIAKTRENKLINANIFKSDKGISDAFKNSVSNIYTVLPLLGDFKGKKFNYDGETDLEEGTGTDTYYYGVTSYGRALVGGEQDYANDIVGKQVNFIDYLAEKMGEEWVNMREDTLISIIKGIYSSTTDGADEFAEKHTLEINGPVEDVSLNNASQKALGDKDFNGRGLILTIMNSVVANDLRNKKLLEYVRSVDANGLEKNTNLAQWGNKLALVDDAITTIIDGSTTKYVTYGIGTDAFLREDDLPVEYPFERVRNSYKKGGRTDLINRERKVMHPRGFSFLKKSVKSDSPTDLEFADGTNWGLAKNADGTKYYPHQLIPIVRIISTDGSTPEVANAKTTTKSTKETE